MRRRFLAAAITLLAWAALGAAHAQTVLERGGWAVEVRPGGGLGRRLADPDYERSVEWWRRRAAAWQGPVKRWRTRFFVFRGTDVDWTASDGSRRHSRVTMTGEEVALVERVIREFGEAVRIYSGGRFEIDGSTRVLEEPLDRVSGTGVDHLAWVDATEGAIGPLVPDLEVDSVFVFWKPGDVEVGTYWGGSSGGAFRGAGYTSIALLGRADIEERSYVEVAIHEWLHQVEWARAARMGYAGLPALHDAQEMGYVAGRFHPGWMTWLVDFLTVYTTPRMWEELEMLRDVRPERPRFEGGFVREWLVAGPFDNADDGALARPPADPTGLRPARSRSIGDQTWRRHAAGSDAIDFNALFRPNERVAALAHAYAFSEVRQPVRLWVGSDDGVRVWVNGRLVHDLHVHRGLLVDSDPIDVVLEPGWNRFLFLVEETIGGWGLSARLGLADGGAVEGVRWAADLPKGAVLAEAEPEPAPRAEYRTFAWRDVAGDPWRLLPVLGPRDLAALAGVPDLELVVAGGEVVLATLPGRPARIALDHGMALAEESLAVLPGRGDEPDLVLVRPDVAEVYAAAARPALLDHLVGRLSAGARPLLVARVRLPRDGAGRIVVEREIDLFPHESDGVSVALHAPGSIPRVVESELHLEVENRGEGEVRLLGLELDLAGGAVELLGTPDLPVAIPPGGHSLLGFRIAAEAPEGRSNLRARLELVRGEDPIALELDRPVDLVDPLAIEILDADRRPWLRAASGTAQGLVLAVENRTRTALPVRIDATLPAGWAWTVPPAASIELAPEARVEVPIAIGIPHANAGSIEGLRLVATASARGREVSTRLGLTFHAAPWWFAGPFDNRDGRGLEREDGPEKGYSVRASFDTPWGPARWFDLVATGATPALDAVDLAGIFPERHEDVTAYAALDLETDRARRVRLLLGSDDGVALWVRGSLLHKKDVRRPAAPDQEDVLVRLDPGRNRIVLEVSQGAGAWGFYFRVVDEDGRPAGGVRVLSPSED